MKQKSEKNKFKIFKSETGRVVYNWVYQCPKCKKIRKFNFENCLWALGGGRGLTMECDCKFGQVITNEDLNIATHLTKDEYIKLCKEYNL